MKRCVNCNKELEDDARFCSNCGTKQPEELRCPECKEKIADKNANFCPKCGAKLSVTVAGPIGTPIGDNNAISAHDIVGGNKESFQGDKVVVQGDKIQAEHYVINQFTGAAPTEKTESEKEKDRLETVRTKRLFKQESEAEIEALKTKAKDFENKMDYFHAVQIYRELAENGDLDAACEVFRIVFEKNYNIDKDVLCKIIEDIILPNAKNGHPFAQAITGKYYATDENKKPDYNEAIKWLEKSTSNGNSFGAFWLAMFYIEDEIDDRFKHSETGVETNNKKAVELLEIAAKQNFGLAISTLANIYFIGVQNIPKNPNESINWAMKGVEIGLSDCMFFLACFYSAGIILDKDDKKAFELFLKAAENGYIEAQREVAEAYLNGVGVDCDIFKAYSWFAKGAESEDVESMYYTGINYYYGTTVFQDINKALNWLKKAFDQDYYHAVYELGLIYSDDSFDGKDEAIATSYFKKGAENGDLDCQYRFGIALIDGLGIAKDVKTGIEWLEKASEYHDWACYNLGYIYSQGEVVKKDIAKAKEYYMRVINKDPSQVDEKAKARAEEALKALDSDNNNPSNNSKSANNNTQSLIAQGDNAINNKNYKLAYKFYKQAEELGEELAEGKLDDFYDLGNELEENKNFRDAVKIYSLMANDGDEDAKSSLANIYVDFDDDVENNEKNYKLGYKLYCELANDGDEVAMANVGCCYELGRGVNVDYNKALEWYQKSIDNGYQVDDWIKARIANAKVMLAKMYWDKKDYKSAYKLYCELANDGNCYAMTIVGSFYESGCGVNVDYNKALEWYQKAIDSGYVLDDWIKERIANAKFQLANMSVNERDYESAYKLYCESADYGNCSAMVGVGRCYRNAIGVNVDYKKALEWYQKAIDSGYVVDNHTRYDINDCNNNISSVPSY